MADTRDKDLTRTTAPATDDVTRLDGATNGTRGILVTDLLAPLYSRVLSGDIGGANADLLFSDGATSNRSVYWALGAAGAVAGQAISIPFEFDVPASSTAAEGTILGFALAVASPPSQYINSLSFSLIGDILRLRQNGDPATNYRIFQHATFRAVYAGQKVRGAVVFEAGDSATAPKVIVNGTDLSASFALSTNGSVPNWLPPALSTANLVMGHSFPGGRFVPYAPILGALTYAEVLVWTQTGRLPTWCDVGTGSMVPRYASDFSVGVDGWIPGGGGGSTIAGNVDSIGGQDNNLEVTIAGGVVSHAPARLCLTVGKAYLAIADVYLPAGSAIPSVYLGVGSVTTGISTKGSWVALSVIGIATDQYLRVVVNAAALDGEKAYVRNVRVYELGPIFKPVIPASGTTILDAGANNLTGTITAGVTPVVTRFTASHIADFAAALLPGTSGRALQPHCLSDNATANRRIEWTPGAAGNVAGKPVTFYGRINVPASNPSATCILAGITATSTPVIVAPGNCYAPRMSTSGDLVVQQVGATNTDHRTLTCVGFRAAYSGRKALPVAVVFENGDTTTNPKIYIDGIDATALFTFAKGGSEPNWMPSTLDCTKFLSGFNWCDTRFEPFRYCLGAWTAAEVLDWTQTGREPMWCEASTGNAVPIYTSNFATADGWSGSTGGSVAASAGRLGVTTVGSNVNSCGFHSFTFSKGGKYRIAITAKVSSAGPTWKVAGQTNVQGIVTAAGVAPTFTPTTSDAAYTFDCLCSDSGFVLGVTLAADATLDVASITVTPLGPIIKPVLQPCMILDDEGANGIPGVITPGIKPVTNKKDWRIRPVIDMTTTGNKQAFGAAFTENPVAQAFDSIEVTHGANGATYSVGDGTTATAYTASAAQTSGRKRLTLTNPFPADAAKTGLYFNVTVAGASETAVPVVIRGHRID